MSGGASIVFLYPGQGCQRYQMGRELYDGEPAFRSAMDECEAAFRGVTGGSLVAALYDPRRSPREPFDDVRLTHPAIVAFEVSLTRALLARGIAPRCLLGYSAGELAAAVAGGVLSLRQGIELAARQAMLLAARAQGGGMLAILERAELVADHPDLFARCSVAAHNFDRHFVVSGARTDLLRLKDALIEREISCSLLPVTVAFHSPLIDGVEPEIRELARDLSPGPARIEIVSSMRVRSIPTWDPDFAWDLARGPVRFQETVAALERRGPHLYLDLGPSPILANFLKHGLPPESRSTWRYVLGRSGAIEEPPEAPDALGGHAARRANDESRQGGNRAMDETREFRLEHSVEVARPAEAVYRLINDVEAWPQIFPPCRAARVVERFGDRITVEITASVGGQVMTWRSRRRLRPADHRVDFEQESSAPPVVSMTGYWLAEPAGDRLTRVALVHDFVTSSRRAAEAQPPKTLDEAEQWIRQVCDANSEAELAAMKAACEKGLLDGRNGGGGVHCSFAEVDGAFVFSDALVVAAPLESVYRMLWEAQSWPELLPHVCGIRFLEERPGYQRFEMETSGAGGTHVTESIRQSDSQAEIRYEQLITPPLLSRHTGRWLFTPVDQGIRIAAEHTVAIRPEAIEKELERPYSVQEAAFLSRHFIGNHSTATLKVVQQRAEALAGEAVAERRAE